MVAKYCPLCKRDVVPVKRFSLVWFLLFCLTGIGGIFYLFYYVFLKRKKECPICGGTVYKVSSGH